MFSAAHGWGDAAIIAGIGRIFVLTVKCLLVQMVNSAAVIILSIIIHNGALIVLIYFGISILESVLYSLFSSVTAAGGQIWKYILYIFPSSYIYELQELKSGGGELLWPCISIAFYIIITLLLGSVVLNRKDIKE